MRRLVASLCSFGLALAVTAPPALAEDEIVYLDAVDLFYDEATGEFLDPIEGTSVELRFDTDTVLDFQELVDSRGWEVPDFLRDEALSFLFDEIALLVELDAISMTPQFATIHAAYAAELEGLDRDDLIAGVLQVDQILDQIKGDVAGYIEGPLPFSVVDAVGDLKAPWKDTITNGGSPIPSLPYVGALSVLMSEGTAVDLDPSELGVEFIGLERRVEFLALPEMLAGLVEFGDATIDGQPIDIDATIPENPLTASDAAVPPQPVIDEGGGAGAAGAAGADGGGQVPIWVIASALAVVGTLFLVLSLRRRRRTPVDVSDAVRRLINADTESAVAAIACGEAAAVTEARRAILCRPSGGGLRVAGTATTVVGSALQRVVETGTPLSTSVAGDALLGPDETSVLAVPVVTSGSVVGVLAVTAGTFDDADRTALEQIAPSTAGALVNVDRLGSMTQLAHIDQLTSLGNRRRLDRDLDATVRLAREQGTPVAFAMVDVDHFKTFNDTNGHAAGDHALRTVAAVIAANVREQDIVYRYGGEEFSILLPYASAEEAAGVAERVRQAVEDAAIPGEETQPNGTLTVSVGVSTLPTLDPDVIAARADQALYDAKQGGRNRVVLDAAGVS